MRLGGVRAIIVYPKIEKLGLIRGSLHRYLWHPQRALDTLYSNNPICDSIRQHELFLVCVTDSRDTQG
jgi:hypothetical protein